MKTKNIFHHLFEPGYIGKLKVPNRIHKLATRTGYAAIDGSVTERLLRHYKEIALGGTGLIVVEPLFIDDKASRNTATALGGSGRRFMWGLALLAQTIHENGAKAAVQILHGGALRSMGPPVKGMSRVLYEDWFARRGVPGLPEELTVEEIAEIVEAFGDSALLAKNCGFDMVEVHAAHGYLLTQSLSPFMNRRQDMYGGTLQNRMRLLLEVIANVRRKVGHDFPLSVRLSATEYVDGGITIEDTLQIVKGLEKAKVDLISITSGCRNSEDNMTPPSYHPLAFNVGYAEKIKKITSLPIVVGGAITTPELAEQILEDGKADFIGLARPLIADPYFPYKAKEGRTEDITPCIRDCEGCWSLQRRGWGGVRCTVNVAVGKEDEFRIKPAEKAKKVAVIGGGPAGLEAARVTALSGHVVTLFEKNKLGGHLIEASTPVFKNDIKRLIEYFNTQLKKLNVKIIKKEAIASDIIVGGFNAVIVATGGKSTKPELLGINKPLVVDALDILNDKAKVGERVIVVGGGLVGCDISLLLAEQGRKVTIVEMLDEIARDMEPNIVKKAFWGRLGKTDVEIHTMTKMTEVINDGIVAIDKYGRNKKLQADSVVLAVGIVPFRWPDLGKIADETEIEVHEAGDCIEPRKIFDAILEGHLAARRLS